MSKQTTVEWLLNNLLINGLLRLTKDEHPLYKELKDHAKAMEKEQRIQDMSKMQIISDVDFDGNVTFMFSPEQYYNETYK